MNKWVYNLYIQAVAKELVVAKITAWYFLCQYATHLYGPMAAGALGVLMIRRITALPTPDAIVHSTRSRPLASKAPPTNHVVFSSILPCQFSPEFYHHYGDRERGGRSDEWRI